MSADDRDLVAVLAKAAKGGVIALPEAARVLRVPQPQASVHLQRLIRQGWVQRLRRGLFLINPLDAAPGQAAVPEDPWVLAREIFAPCYIGGWSAAEYWELTEQLFRSTLVVTGAHARQTNARIGGHLFRVFRIPSARLLAGVEKVWRGRERVEISGLERTLVDALRNPELVGGGRHLVQILRAYGEHDRRDFHRLVGVASNVASGAAWKRLGFLAERLWPHEPNVAEVAARHLSTGLVRLDPGVGSHGRLATRWRLWVNVSASELTAHHGSS